MNIHLLKSENSPSFECFLAGRKYVHPSLNELCKNSHQFPYKRRNDDGLWEFDTVQQTSNSSTPKLSCQKYDYYQSKFYKRKMRYKIRNSLKLLQKQKKKHKKKRKNKKKKKKKNKKNKKNKKSRKNKNYSSKSLFKKLFTWSLHVTDIAFKITATIQ